MPIFYLTDGEGNFIMSAPLSTVASLFGLTADVQDAVLRQTASGGEAIIELIPPHNSWTQLRIRKLSLEITSLSTLLKEQAG